MAEKKVVELEVKDNLDLTITALKKAQREVAELTEKFGATSQEAINAAKRAADLKDKIQDAKALTDAFNPDAKFNALSASIGGVLNGFQAYQGALGLIGVESKEVEETLLKVQSAMALSQGVQGLLEAKDSFIQLKAVIGQTAIGQKVLTAGTVVYTGVQKALNFVMKQNPIFLILGGVTALAGAFAILTSRTEDQVEAEKKLSDFRKKRNEEVNKELEQELKKREIRKGGLQDLENELKKLQAKGASEKVLFEAEKKIIQERLNLLGYVEGYRGKLSRDEYKEKKQLLADLEILELQYNKNIIDAKQKLQQDKKQKNKEQEQDYYLSTEELNKIDQERTERIKDQTQRENDELDERSKSRMAWWQFLIDGEKKQSDEEKLIASQKKEFLVNSASSTLQTLGNLAQAFAGKSEKAQRRAFNIQKAVSIAQATIDTYKAANAAFASGSEINVAYGVVSAALAIATGLANVAQIAKQKFEGGSTSGGGGGSSVGSNSSPSNQQSAPPSFNIVGNSNINQAGLTQQPIEAYVVSGNVTSQQALDRNRLKNATFG